MLTCPVLAISHLALMQGAYKYPTHIILHANNLVMANEIAEAAEQSKGTLSSILTIKFASKRPAHQFESSKELLKKAKSATSEYSKLSAFQKPLDYIDYKSVQVYYNYN